MTNSGRIIKYFVVAFVIIFIAIQIFNRTCLLTHQCKPIYFSKLIPRKEGTKLIGISFNVINYRSDLQFTALDRKIITPSNRINTAKFFIRNTSDKKITFRPKLLVQPRYFHQYLTTFNCLCSQKYSLSPQEFIELEMDFFIDPLFEKDEDFDLAFEDPEKDLLSVTYEIE
jgi:cytochrome c oxidase assembly protein Cox11